MFVCELAQLFTYSYRPSVFVDVRVCVLWAHLRSNAKSLCDHMRVTVRGACMRYMHLAIASSCTLLFGGRLPHSASGQVELGASGACLLRGLHALVLDAGLLSTEGREVVANL